MNGGWPMRCFSIIGNNSLDKSIELYKVKLIPGHKNDSGVFVEINGLSLAAAQSYKIGQEYQVVISD